MRNLLAANFRRLWKSRLFWLVVAFMSLGSVCINWAAHNEQNTPEVFAETLLFYMLPFTGFVFLLFISMRLGTEFEECTIRNKLIIGHSRTQVYFAECITCMAASAILMTVMLLSSAAFARLLSLEYQYSHEQLAFLVLCCVLIALVYAAMFVGINMNVGSRAVSLVVSFLFLLAIFSIAAAFCSALEEPQTTYEYVNFTNEGVQYGDLIQNPDYIAGTRRTVYELVAGILPSGQCIQLHNLEYSQPIRWPLYSLLMLAVSLLAGYLPFRRKNIR